MILQIKSYKTINGKNQRVLLAFASLLLLLLLMASFATFASLPSSASSSEPNAVPTYIYVANSGDNTVSVINGTTNTVVTTIKVGYGPGSIAFDPTTGWIYVANAGHPYSGDGNISVISPFTNKVIKTFDDPDSGMFIDVKGELWVTNAYQSVGTISIISPTNGSVLRTIEPCNCSQISDEAYSPGTNEVYAVPITNGNVSIISVSTLSVVGHLKVQGEFTGHIVYDPQNRDLYASYYSNKVLVINQENHVVKKITVGYRPYSLAYDSSNHDIYVGNLGSNTTSVIDTHTNSVVATIKHVGYSSFGMAFDRSNFEIYITNGSSNNVAVIRGTMVLTKIIVGNAPVAVSVD